MYKPEYRKDIVLKAMESTVVMEGILFDPENDGFFRVDSTAKPLAKMRYVGFLKDSSARWGRWGIWFKGEEVGFILAAGIDCRLVGGVKSTFQRKGIYSAARQCVIKTLNDLGQFSITSSYHAGNVKMKQLNAGVPTTTLDDSLVVNHFDPMKSMAVMEKIPSIDPRGSSPTLYHISLDDNLPSVLSPRLPDAGGEEGDDDEEAEEWYPEPAVPRVSFSPSVEFCFRAVYPNISHLLEGTDRKDITFTVYKALPTRSNKPMTPLELHEQRWIHDAFITQEHVFLRDIGIKKIGTVTFLNTSDDKGLHYLPFNEGDVEYHSPLNVIKT